MKHVQENMYDVQVLVRHVPVHVVQSTVPVLRIWHGILRTAYDAQRLSSTYEQLE